MYNSCFFIAVRASDKHISNPEEYSDSEDEGDNRRDIHMVKESNKRKRRKGAGTPIQKMVTNGVENAANEDTKATSLSNDVSFSKASTSPVEDKEKAKTSNDSPKEGSPQTVANTTAEATTEPAPEQEANRKR